MDAKAQAAITRLTVVGPDGRESEHWNVAVYLDVQDNGQTLKVFYSDRPGPKPEPLADWEIALLNGTSGITSITEEYQLNLDWPEGTRVTNNIGLVYTYVNGQWRHDDRWRERGTTWCDCNNPNNRLSPYALKNELPASVLVEKAEL